MRFRRTMASVPVGEPGAAFSGWKGCDTPPEAGAASRESARIERMEKRTRSVGTKLTEAEYERLERAAEARGLKLASGRARRCGRSC